MGAVYIVHHVDTEGPLKEEIRLLKSILRKQKVDFEYHESILKSKMQKSPVIILTKEEVASQIYEIVDKKYPE